MDILPLRRASSAAHHLSADSTWPETKHGVAVQVACRDFAQYCRAAAALLGASPIEYFSPAMSLSRGISERAHVTVAAAYDQRFAHRYVDGPELTALSTGKKSKIRNGDAVAVIRRLAAEAGATDIKGLNEALSEVRRLGSTFVHPTASLPSFTLGAPEDGAEAREMLVGVLEREVMLGLYMVAWAVQHTVGITDAVKQAMALVHAWMVEEGVTTIDDLTDGNPSRLE